MKTLHLEPYQLDNLKSFLDRVTVKGITENTAYMELVLKIEEARGDNEDSALQVEGE